MPSIEDYRDAKKALRQHLEELGADFIDVTMRIPAGNYGESKDGIELVIEVVPADSTSVITSVMMEHGLAITECNCAAEGFRAKLDFIEVLAEEM